LFKCFTGIKSFVLVLLILAGVYLFMDVGLLQQWVAFQCQLYLLLK